jgi:hypothetical protein
MLSVTVYDRYGVRYMSNMTMTLDGVKVAPTWKPWAGYGFRKFTLKYAAMNMSVGTHTVVVRIHDRANHTVNYSWSFTVAPVVSDTVPPVTTALSAFPAYPGFGSVLFSATDAGSGVAHTYWKLDGGPQMEGPLLYSFASGTHTVEYWSVDKAGNVEAHKTLSTFVSKSHAVPTLAADASCLVAGCHASDNIAAIHGTDACVDCHGGSVGPTNDCSTCHGASSPPAHHDVHQVIGSSAAAGSAADCTKSACHGTSVVAIHPTCATCHTSTDSTVVGAIAAGNATCETCHGAGFFAATHGSTNASHVVSGSCFVSTCHGTDVTAMHVNDFRGTGALPPGCAACHAAGKTPSTNCTTCHADVITPHDYVRAHARVQPLLAANSTACVACHGSDIKNVLPAGNPVTGVIEHNGCSCHAYYEARNKTACEGCHNGAHAPHGFVNGVSRGEGWIAASGHNTANFGTIGAKTKFDGTQGVTLKWESEIASASLNATWMVGGQGPVYAPLTSTGVPITSISAGQVGTVTTTWTFPTVNVFWSTTDTAAPPTAIKNLTAASVVTCQDCHTGLNAAGPHGAAQNWGIDPNYPGDYSYAMLTKWIVTNPSGIRVASTLDTISVSATSGLITSDVQHPELVGTVPAYSGGSATSNGPSSHAVICAKCHDLENGNSGTTFGTTALPWYTSSGATTTTPTGLINTSWVGASNTAHASHHQDTGTMNVDGSPQCVNCHIAIPHGWKMPRLLVDTDVDTAPYVSANMLGTTRATSTGEENSGDTRGLPNPAGVAHPGFNGQGMQSLSGVDNHLLVNGAAIWTEASCQACGDHAGEDGVRIVNP